MRNPWLCAFVISTSFVTAAAWAQAPRTYLTAVQFGSGEQSTKLVPNSAFLPSSDAVAAGEPFSGTISIIESAMTTEPANFKTEIVLGKSPKLFPGVNLSFVTHNGDLVPATQEVIRAGSTTDGQSFWDIIVQPGKVWSEPGDDGWSRAAFPFALMRSIEGETHNGVASFLYKAGKISNLRYQIIQQTSPFYIETYFNAAGSLPASLKSEEVESSKKIIDVYARSLAAAEPIGTWETLSKKVGGDKLAGFDSTIRPGEIVLDGLMLDDHFYLKSCPTAMGELPFCERQRFGVWSVTKSAATAVAMLRLAEKYGPEVFDLKIADYITEIKGIAGWEKVTFGNALNMATGMGYGSDKADPVSIFEPFGPEYYAWYEANSEKARLEALVKGAKAYPWGSGKVARYRDEDMFLLGAAMTAYLKQKEGPDANVWDFIIREVYTPIGIHYAPSNKTIEEKGLTGQPLMAYGYYPQIGDLVKIARLYQSGGKFNGKQLLNAQKLEDILAHRADSGLPTGVSETPFYHKAFWRAPMTSVNGCSFSYPIMDGWGKNFVSLMPRGITTFRLAKNWDGDAGSSSLASLTSVADRLANLCKP